MLKRERFPAFTKTEQGEKKMKNLRKWTMADIEKVLKGITYPDGYDYKESVVVE